MSSFKLIRRIISQVKRVISIPRRVHSKVQKQYSKRERSKRFRQINQIPGVVAPEGIAFLSTSAKLDIESSGFAYGGTIRLSDGDRISDGVILAPYGGSIDLEEDVFLGPYCVLYGHGGIKIGKNTLVAGHTFIVAANHSFADLGVPVRLQDETKAGITIGEDVWIGCGVKILDGVSIGDQCVIGAGAVVTKSLPARSIAVGVPARVVGRRGQ